ncbi:hypothetical protein [Metapseudomonas otitidis]|uniref:hypothetical protein n=1 Tax=Metapseudomonas otitidis TaxID=319939 RepID=UPI0013F601EF|nr:hypothetical protein [Pseudomonas otitidis]
MKITEFFCSVGIKLDKASFNRVDKQLLQFEKKIKTMMTRLDKSLKLELPAITVKKFKFDELALQRNSQMSLNRVGRLLELPIHNFKVNESKLQKQMQGVMQRAANAARINVKTVQGSAGGSNAFFPKLPTVYQYGNSHSLPQMSGNSSFGVGGMIPLPNPVVAGAAAIGASAYYAGTQVNQLRKDQTSVEAQRVKLDVASGQKDRASINKQNEAFFNLANMTGTDATQLVDSYAQMMKTLQAIGLSSSKSFDLYKDMSVFAKSTGADGQQMGRAAYAIGQIYGKGYVAREELQLQLADALPSFKKYLMEAYTAQTGKSSFQSFDKALTDKQITTGMLEQAFKNAALAGMSNVQQYANTAQGLENQYSNQKLQEQMARTLSDDVIPSAKRLTEAQAKLYDSTVPLRDAFYKLSASALDTTADVLNFGAFLGKKHLNDDSGQKLASLGEKLAPMALPLSTLGPAGLMAQMGMTAYNFPKPDIPVLALPSPLMDQKKSWQHSADKAYSFDRLLQGMTPATQNVSVGDVNITLNSSAANGEDLVNELRPVIRQELGTAISSTLLNFPNKE